MRINRRLIRLSAVFLAGFVASLAFVLESSSFRSWRNALTADFLTDLLGQTVLVEGNVDLDFFPSFSLEATGLRLPSEAMPGTELLTLETARLHLAPWTGAAGWTQLPMIEANGLRMELLRLEDDRTSWRTAQKSIDQKRGMSSSDASPALIRFMSTRDIHFSDMKVAVENRQTGFVFDFVLDTFRVDQKAVAGEREVALVFDGKLNDEHVTLHGVFPEDEAFSVTSRIGVTDLSMRGHSDPSLGPLGFDSRLEIKTEDLNAVLQALSLRGEVHGSGRLEARFLRRHGLYDFEEIETLLTLEKGQSVKLAGFLRKVGEPPEFDLKLDVDLLGEKTLTAPAIFLRDIRPEALGMRLVGADKLLSIEDFNLATNAFSEHLSDIGPFRVGDIKRTPDGKLALRDVSFALGPLDKPFFSAAGHMDDLLNLRGYDVKGDLDLPAAQVLRTLRPERVHEFGRLLGHVYITEVDGRTVLEDFEIEERDSDLWDGYLSLRSESLFPLKDTSLSVALSAPDGASFLEALQLTPVDTGAAGVALDLVRHSKGIEASGEVSTGETRISLMGDLNIIAGAPVLRGSINSKAVYLRDLQNAIRTVREVSREPGVYLEMRSVQLKEHVDPTASEDLSGFQPLVLPAAEPELREEDLSDFQPLVLPSPAPAVEDLSDFQPLVLGDDAGDLSLAALKNPAELLRVLDAEIDITFDKIIGQEGISHMASAFTAQNGRAWLGPLRVDYGGGFASFFATVDALNRPDWIELSGSTGGWDVGRLTNGLGGKVHATGTLTGRFDLAARFPEPQDFASSLTGSAEIEMGPGQVSTTLIDLAGLGVLPWLFSADRRAGFSPISCIRAPLRFDSGRVTINDAVLETARVQVVAKGDLDYLKDTIDLRAEPRPLGRPLARSAWPFEISGQLSKPIVKLVQRNKRRATEPITMPDSRVPCIADVAQIRAAPNPALRTGPH